MSDICFKITKNTELCKSQSVKTTSEVLNIGF